MRLSGSEIRRLRELREMIKVESLKLPARLQRRLLEILEETRPWQIPPRAVPEMSRGELVRAIRWRLGTIPLAGAIAAADFVTRHRSRRRPQPARRAGSDRTPGRRTHHSGQVPTRQAGSNHHREPDGQGTAV